MVAAKIVFIGTPEADAGEFAALAAADFPTLDLFATNDRDAAMTEVADAHAIMAHHFQFDAVLLERARLLRWIQSLTTGTDGIVRLPGLRPEVIITSTRGMHGPQMSELVFLQMLALSRRFAAILRNQRERRWERWPQPLLLGKVIVIVGVGTIAEALALRCEAFGMHVYGVSQSRRVPRGFAGIFSRAQLTEAAAMADFLVLVVPYSADTDGLIDERVLAAMRPSAFVINVARGGVLDERALLDALRGHRIAGAALDVFRETPLPSEDPLWVEEGVIITPMLGGMSDIYLDQAYPIIRTNLSHFLNGELGMLQNVVDR